MVNGNKLVYQATGSEQIQLVYDDLKVWDANGKTLSAHMELNNNGDILSIVVDDKHAVYPVTVDPLNKTPEWTTSADGILPGLLNNLNLQVQTLYGYSVAGLGDINNDGYDDVAIGAPGMADVITGSGSLLSVGAVFIYLGSSSGLPVVPSKVLQPTTPVAGALFGLSISAGNITSDGINDVLIGAPFDRYTTTASGLFGSTNVTVTAGKVYVYRSEDLFATANPSAFVQLRLQGSNFFSTGIAGVLASNINANPLFGYSVSTTDDLNGDGKEDIIVGSPGYVGISLTAVKSGAAFVYYSNSLSTIDPVVLSLPTASVLGLVSLPAANLDGLLFGFSVDGIGDFNNDGFPDVAVGAPAGVNLSSLGGIFSGQILGGSAFVYYGSSTGINSSIGARLQAASSGLLSNAANLFGYKVTGVKNAVGVRNGNLLVSAPTGNVLSNVLPGLQLKAGAVHVFRKKTSAFTSPVVSDQALSSPRANSVLSLLAGQTLNASLLYGADTDNMRDVNCDGISDIIVGEPLSTSIPVLGANVTGGAAYIYLGKVDGTFQPMPIWTLSTEVSPLLGVNATALVGFSVAGAGHTHGTASNVRAIVGGPTNALDFGTGLLNLGNTMGTLFSFTFDNNGLGKSYGFRMNLCGIVTLPTNLLSFTGREVEKSAKLFWATESEQNVNYYELQRSTDGVNFSPVALVFADGQQQNNYTYRDPLAQQGKNFYRLRIVDHNSQFTYSNIIILLYNNPATGAVIVAPNPVQNEIRLKMTGFETGIYIARLYNSAGQLVTTRKFTVTMPEQTEVIQRTGNMIGGSYFVSLHDKNNTKVGTVSLLLSK